MSVSNDVAKESINRAKILAGPLAAGQHENMHLYPPTAQLMLKELATAVCHLANGLEAVLEMVDLDRTALDLGPDDSDLVELREKVGKFTIRRNVAGSNPPLTDEKIFQTLNTAGRRVLEQAFAESVKGVDEVGPHNVMKENLTQITAAKVRQEIKDAGFDLDDPAAIAEFQRFPVRPQVEHVIAALVRNINTPALSRGLQARVALSTLYWALGRDGVSYGPDWLREIFKSADNISY